MGLYCLELSIMLVKWNAGNTRRLKLIVMERFFRLLLATIQNQNSLLVVNPDTQTVTKPTDGEKTTAMENQ